MPRGLSNLAGRASLLAATLGAAVLLASATALAAPCGGAPSSAETKCKTAIQIPGKPLRSFDISWVDPKIHLYFLGDRSNAGVDIIDTAKLKFKTTVGGFVGIVLNPNGTVANDKSGPDGVTSLGRFVFAGDGNSTLKVIDLKAKGGPTIIQSISTGGMFRVDEMGLSADGKFLIAANNADDPTFATLFSVDVKNKSAPLSILRKYTVSPTVLPVGFGLSLEQPIWESVTKRFYVSVPVIANNPTGCDFGQPSPPTSTPCQGGMIVLDPTQPNPVGGLGVYSPTTRIGVFALPGCAPNGIAVGPDSNILEGCTPNNNPTDRDTLIISVLDPSLFKSVLVQRITGSDEDWFDSGSNRYYLAASAMPGGAVLGVIDADTNQLVESIPQSSSAHSVAADNKRNRIFVPQVAPVSVVGSGGDKTNVGAALCGQATNGCVVVFTSKSHHEE